MKRRRVGVARIGCVVVLLAVLGCGGEAPEGNAGGAEDSGPAIVDAGTDLGSPVDVSDAPDASGPLDVADTLAPETTPCPAGTAGCPCAAGCKSGLVCDATTTKCRTPKTCSQTPCAANQDCAQEPGKDATCLPSCAPGFTWNAATSSCDVSVIKSNCDATGEASILAACNAKLMVCVPDATAGALCSGCQPFAVPDGNTKCRKVITCAELPCSAQHRKCDAQTATSDASCGACQQGYADQGGTCVLTATTLLTCKDLGCSAAEACFEGFPGKNAYCEPRPCAKPNQACNTSLSSCDAVSVVCKDCTIACGDGNGGPGSGETGRIWGWTTASGTCLCETETGYWQTDGQGAYAQLCDADGDGWTTVTAYEFIDGKLSKDPALHPNARCPVQRVDRVALQNEFHQRQLVYSCQAGGFTPALEDGSSPCPKDAQVLGLYEPEQLDSDTAMTQEEVAHPGVFPVVDGASGTGGRRLLAREVNALTRACTTEAADYNRNGKEDVGEYQGYLSDTIQAYAALVPLQALTHFVELHRTWTEFETDLAVPGKLVIAERSRQEQAFPVQYAPTEGPYWRECTRNRDATYEASPADGKPAVGFDFARWGCASPNGTCDFPGPSCGKPPGSVCSRPPPPIAAVSSSTIPPHGLSTLGATGTPPDGVWRGMNHHGQFRCAVVKTKVDPLKDGKEVLASSVLFDAQQPANLWQLNACRACSASDPQCGCVGDGLACTSEPPTSSAPSALTPRVVCQPIAMGNAATRVGFVAARYQTGPLNAYLRGCLPEWVDIGGFEFDGIAAGAAQLGFTPAELATLLYPWNALCPGFADQPKAVSGQANPKDFGRLVCGCNVNYGGVACDQGCPQPLYGGPKANTGANAVCQEVGGGYCPKSDTGGPEGTGGRSGAWLCGTFGATSTPNHALLGPVLAPASVKFAPDKTPLGPVLRGGIRLKPVVGTLGCSGQACNGPVKGPVIRP